jgi:hypothetical protein
MLVLLKLSFAFDHSIFLHRLEHYFGVRLFAGLTLTSKMEHNLCSEGSESKHCKLRIGVPQGSVLGPLLFAIDMLPLGDIIRSFGISFICNANDTQLFISVESRESAQIQKVGSCLSAVKSWMSQIFLQLSTGKTEPIILSSKRHQRKFETVSHPTECICQKSRCPVRPSAVL